MAAMAALLTTIATAPGPSAAQSAAAVTSRDGHSDFNFEYGTWRTHYRLLKKRLANNHEWVTCEGTSVIRPFFGGYGNIEDGDLMCPNRYIGGLTIRTYSAATHQWTIWWATKKDGIDPPAQVGHFDADGTGEFYAHDIQVGKHVIVRFKWTHPNGVPYFEQAFSADNGKTWETNWTTTYERVSESSKGTWNVVAPAGDGHTGFDFLLGSWNFHLDRLLHPLANSHDWVGCDGTTTVTPFWGGDGNIQEGRLRCPGGKTIDGLTIRLYDPATHQWQLWWGTKTGGLQSPPPQLGRFDANGVGNFDAPDTFDGRPIIVRYKWQKRNGHPYFQQLYSADNGKTWEVNWITTYTRST